MEVGEAGITRASWSDYRLQGNLIVKLILEKRFYLFFIVLYNLCNFFPSFLTNLTFYFQAKAKDLKKILIPLLNLVKSGKISGNGAIYVQTRFNVYLTYLLNISFYISIKAKRESLTGHPIVGRLVQYRSVCYLCLKICLKLER